MFLQSLTQLIVELQLFNRKNGISLSGHQTWEISTFQLLCIEVLIRNLIKLQTWKSLWAQNWTIGNLLPYVWLLPLELPFCWRKVALRNVRISVATSRRSRPVIRVPDPRRPWAPSPGKVPWARGWSPSKIPRDENAPVPWPGRPWRSPGAATSPWSKARRFLNQRDVWRLAMAAMAWLCFFYVRSVFSIWDFLHIHSRMVEKQWGWISEQFLLVSTWIRASPGT